MRIQWTYFILKFSVIIAIFAAINWRYAVPLIYFVTWVYQYVIGFFLRIHPLPSLDILCFCGTAACKANCISVTFFEKMDVETAKKRIRSFILAKEKLRYRIRIICGDYYYEETPIDEVMEHAFNKIPADCKDERDIEKFCSEVINQ